jgi:hypothetical protein
MAGSGDYVLAMSANANPGAQPNWRFCESCFVLWYTAENGSTGHCPARPGQGHLQSTSPGGAYFLSEVGSALSPAPLQQPPD